MVPIKTEYDVPEDPTLDITTPILFGFRKGSVNGGNSACMIPAAYDVTCTLRASMLPGSLDSKPPSKV